MKNLFVLLILTSLVSAFTIPEEVRYTNGSGFSTKMSSKAFDYLKVAYLPWVYDQIQNSTISDFDVKDGKLDLNLKNVTARLEGPEQTFIRDWKTSLLTNDTSLNVAHANQDMNVDLDFLGKMSRLQIAKGHLSAKIVNITFDFKTEFQTQKA